MQHQTIAVIDYGSQYSQLICRRVREAHVYAELIPWDRAAEILPKMKPAGMHFFYGCTGNNTETTIDTVKFAKASGADGAILAAPSYICASENDIERFFLDVADATDLSLIHISRREKPSPVSARRDDRHTLSVGRICRAINVRRRVIVEQADELVLEQR